MPDETNATPQAAEPKPAPQASPPPGANDGKAASGAASVETPAAKPLSAKEHAAIEKAKYEAREAKRALKERETAAAQQLKAEQDMRAKLEADLADLRKQFESMSKGNPLKGRADAEAVIREFVEGETPERKTAAEIAEAKRVAQEAVQRAERIEAERKKEREDQQAAQAAANKARAVDGFAQSVTSGDEAKKYAYLNAMHTRTEIRAMAAEIQEWAESEGKTFTYEQVALHLDKRAKSLYDERKERLDALRAVESGGSAASAGLAPPASTGRAGNGSAGNGHRNGPGTDASPKKPPSRTLTRQQEEEEDLAMLRKATAADAAERNRQAKAAKH